MSEPRRALLVDDDPMVLEATAAVLQDSASIRVIGSASSAAAARTALEDEVPDVVVTDLILGPHQPDGIQLTKAIKAAHPMLPVVLLSGYDEAVFAERAIEAGAAGFVMKTSPVDVLVEAVQTAIGGGIWVSRSVREQLMLGPQGVDLGGVLDATLLQELQRGNRSVVGLRRVLGWPLSEVERELDRACMRLGLPGRVALYLAASYQAA